MAEMVRQRELFTSLFDEKRHDHLVSKGKCLIRCHNHRGFIMFIYSLYLTQSEAYLVQGVDFKIETSLQKDVNTNISCYLENKKFPFR